MQAFSDVSGLPSTYHLVNFNCLFSSMVTLFTLMVVNNWMVTVSMYVYVMNSNTNYRFFFISFYYNSVIIGVNLFVAFVLDMYASVERLDNEKMKTLELLEEEISGRKVDDDQQLAKIKAMEE